MEDGRIQDSQITASSVFSSSVKPANARLNLPFTTERQGGWEAKHSNLYQWLQVDLLKQVNVLAIATQGRDLFNYWVTSYSLQSSDDGAVFIDYNGGQILQGNLNQWQVVKRELLPAIIARYIRVLPKSWQNSVAMRIELYGCDAD